MSKEKKMAAAISAVMAYIRTEEELATLQSMPPHQQMPSPAQHPATDSVSLWGISGRQTQMQTRLQMQIKAFHRFKNGNS
ncbi:MAG TPA: hypothetical protein ENI07_14510 [Desulfobacterales bacterium]|nr:hypothetical protein [Desulfobacterales bacterium]